MTGCTDPAKYLEQVREKASDAYIIVEKILGSDEDLPGSWPIQGSTGYDFAAHVNGLFCVGKHERAFKRIYSEFTGSRSKFEDLLVDKKQLIIIEHMAGDVNNLVQLVKTLSSRDRHGADATLFGLRRALTEVLAAFPVYRTYINDEIPADNDRQYINAAVDRAVTANPGLLHELMFIKRFLLMEFPAYLDEERKADWLKVTMRFQQMTGPVMAKGFEDTTLYVYNRLISLNEVGGRPDNFGCSVKKFHRFNKRRRRSWPHSLSATSTHDTKRGEDIRARINVLSEIPEEWEEKIKLWNRINKSKKSKIKGANVPDRNDEYFLYQTLLGAFPFGESEYPDFVERTKNYIIKAVREAKIHTEWIKPDARYEEAYLSFLEALLYPSEDNHFLSEFLPFQRKIAHYGIFNSLSQTLIKITSPGIPDFYQGTELWDLNLVDPDNRRPANFELRTALLEDLRRKADSDVLDLAHDLLATKEDGRIKIFLVARGLHTRNANAPLFGKGRYIPLETAGKFSRHVVAFARKHLSNWSLTIAPRFFTSLVKEGESPLGPAVWEDTAIILPESAPEDWRNAITNERLDAGSTLMVGAALEHFSVALFVHLEAHEVGSKGNLLLRIVDCEEGSDNGIANSIYTAVFGQGLFRCRHCDRKESPEFEGASGRLDTSSSRKHLLPFLGRALTAYVR